MIAVVLPSGPFYVPGMSDALNFKQELVGCFGYPVAENPTQAMIEPAFQENWQDVLRRKLGLAERGEASLALATALLDAMALGRPDVTTSAGGSGEIPVDGESGLIVPPRDAAALADAAARARALGRRSSAGRATHS